MHYIIKKAFNELYPDKEIDFESRLRYSKAFKGYNANVKFTKTYKEFRLSYLWKDVSDEIKIGLIQSLLNKVYHTKISTLNQELYEIFLKKLPVLTPKTEFEPLLIDSFNRVNAKYLDSLIIMPNLEWGGKNFRTLGTYDYGTDTIRISNVLSKDQNLLDYVMYHECLHKKFKFQKNGTRTVHHSREFREWERRYEDPEIEDKLKKFLRKKRLMDSIGLF